MENEATLRQPGEAFDAYMQRVVETQQATMMQEGMQAMGKAYKDGTKAPEKGSAAEELMKVA